MPPTQPPTRGHHADKALNTALVPDDLPIGWTSGIAKMTEHKDCEMLEYQSLVEVGYCKESSKNRVEELDSWRAQSKFLVIKTNHEEIVGCVRILVGNWSDLPIGHFKRHEGLALTGPVLEYASLCAAKHARSNALTGGLFVEVWKYALENNVGSICGIMADWLLDILNDIYKLGFVPLGPVEWYMGSDCIPAGNNVVDVAYNTTNHPFFLEYANRGVALEKLKNQEVADMLQRGREHADFLRAQAAEQE